MKELFFSTQKEKPVEQEYKNISNNQNAKKPFNNEEDEVRFSFNNDQYKNRFMSIETNLALPNKYFEAEVSIDREHHKNQAINPNTQREIKEESKIEYSYASYFTRTKGNSWKVKDGETVKSSPIPPKENTKMFNFTDSSDDNEENFFSSPKLNNLQIDSRNLLPSLKEKKSDVNKSFKSQQTNNQDKHGRENSFKFVNPEKETKQLDTLNNTKKSVKNVTSPKSKKIKDVDPVKSKAIKKDNNPKKKVPAPNKKNLTRSLSRSRSKSRKKVFRKNISEQFNENKKEKSIITNTTTQNDKSNLSNVNDGSYTKDKDKFENEKLKEENKKLKEENTLLRKLLEKERQKNEKFNNLAEEFIKFYE